MKLPNLLDKILVKVFKNYRCISGQHISSITDYVFVYQNTNNEVTSRDKVYDLVLAGILQWESNWILYNKNKNRKK